MKIIARFLLLMLPLLILSGCKHTEDEPESGYIFDFAPMVFYLHVTDKGGNNLLIPDTEKTIVGSEACILHSGKRYDIQWNSPYPGATSRLYLARFYGMWHGNSNHFHPEKEPEWVIKVGELDGAFDCDTSIQLHIAGEDHTLRVTNKVKEGKKGIPNIRRYYYLDDLKQESPVFTISLNR